MLPPVATIKKILSRRIQDAAEQGCDTDLLGADAVGAVSGYDDAVSLAQRIGELPNRADWPYVEPDDLPAIERESEIATLEVTPVRQLVDLDERVRAAFLGSVCGCMLGKPVEVDPTMDQLRTAFSAVGEWPIEDYVCEAMLDSLGRRHNSWAEAERSRIRIVAHDDDITYPIVGMLLLERCGCALSPEDILAFWLRNLPNLTTFGPERNTLTTAALWSVYRDERLSPHTFGAFTAWNRLWNFFSEYCGAQIRADPYGYAAPGDPAKAARLAYIDASLTHRKTGIYAAMFTAAAIALSFTELDTLAVFKRALLVVPLKSRFHQAVSESIRIVEAASDWVDAYATIHATYGQYNHCRVLQESGTLINSLCFASSVSDAFCKQVMQGNDTDSYGCTAGALGGARFGLAGLDERWLEPLNDTIHTPIATFHEHSLSAVADRMATLYRTV